MDDDFLNLGEVAIYAYKDPIYYRGDTLVYVADSFATRENAVVEDLLKQLPGIVVETDGRITSQGNQISKVYVDGEDRKSTRLNSSHVRISYAVFCLKKKKRESS